MIMNGTIMKKPQEVSKVEQSSPSEEQQHFQQQQIQVKHTCSICKEVYYDQLKFFGHLKDHYEFPGGSHQQLSSLPQQPPPPPHPPPPPLLTNSPSTINLISDYQAAEILIEASTSSNVHLQQAHQQQGVGGGRSSGGGLHHQPSHRIVAVSSPGQTGSIQVYRFEQSGDEDGRIITSGQSFEGEIELKINTEEDIKHSSEDGTSICVVQDGEHQTELFESLDKPVKVLLKCSKCRRTFRREKTYQTHVQSCQKPDGSEETDAPASTTSKAKAKRTKGKQQQHEIATTNIIVLPQHEEDEGKDDECEGYNLEEGDNSNDDHVHLEDDPLAGGDEEDILDDSNVCPICDELYTSRANLEIHLSKAHPEVRIGPRNSPSSGSKSTPKKKKPPAQKKQEVLKCSECSRIFNHRNSLVYHMRSHTGERPHQCDICGKSFFATSALKVHMRLHSGEKPYKCEHCDRNFRQWGDLKYHVISIHSDIRQYQCEYCGKDFARKYSLIVHRRIHTGERNYKCEFCDKAFRAASYLQNHRRIHTGEKPHACSVCGKPFRVRSDMKRHMASHNRDQHGHHGSAASASMTAATSASSSVQQNTQSLMNGANGAVINVSNTTASELIAAVGPSISQLVHHSRVQTIEVPVSASEIIVGQQQVTIDDTTDEVISGDMSDGTPINITLQDGRLPEGTSLSVPWPVASRRKVPSLRKRKRRLKPQKRAKKRRKPKWILETEYKTTLIRKALRIMRNMLE